jgi:DnaJ-class molecular chaperone
MCALSDDDATYVTCPRCKGEGHLVRREETPTGYRIVRVDDDGCWVCGGHKTCPPARAAWWQYIGSPEKEPR